MARLISTLPRLLTDLRTHSSVDRAPEKDLRVRKQNFRAKEEASGFVQGLSRALLQSGTFVHSAETPSPFTLGSLVQPGPMLDKASQK